MIRLTFFATRNDDRLRHRQIGLPRPGRPDAEHDVVRLDRVEVAALVDRLRRDAALAGRRQAALEEVLAQIDRLVLRDQVGRRLHVGVRQLVAVPHQRRQLADDAVDVLRARGVAVHEELVALRADADVEQRLEVLEVLVVGAEQRLDAFFRNGDAFDCVYLLIIQRLSGAL